MEYGDAPRILKPYTYRKSPEGYQIGVVDRFQLFHILKTVPTEPMAIGTCLLYNKTIVEVENAALCQP